MNLHALCNTQFLLFPRSSWIIDVCLNVPLTKIMVYIAYSYSYAGVIIAEICGCVVIGDTVFGVAKCCFMKWQYNCYGTQHTHALLLMLVNA